MCLLLPQSPRMFCVSGFHSQNPCLPHRLEGILEETGWNHTSVLSMALQFPQSQHWSGVTNYEASRTLLSFTPTSDNIQVMVTWKVKKNHPYYTGGETKARRDLGPRSISQGQILGSGLLTISTTSLLLTSTVRGRKNLQHDPAQVLLPGALESWGSAQWFQGDPRWPSAKEFACQCRGWGFHPWGLGRSPGEENSNPLQYSCLENPMNRGAWWSPVHGVTESQTQLSSHAYQTSCPFAHKGDGGNPHLFVCLLTCFFVCFGLGRSCLN